MKLLKTKLSGINTLTDLSGLVSKIPQRQAREKNALSLTGHPACLTLLRPHRSGWALHGVNQRCLLPNTCCLFSPSCHRSYQMQKRYKAQPPTSCRGWCWVVCESRAQLLAPYLYGLVCRAGFISEGLYMLRHLLKYELTLEETNRMNIRWKILSVQQVYLCSLTSFLHLPAHCLSTPQPILTPTSATLQGACLPIWIPNMPEPARARLQNMRGRRREAGGAHQPNGIVW